MPRTAKELSPEELKQYHLRLNQHFQNRDPVDEALLCRAWQIACQVAVMLYENFGATQVAVFGSLAERDWFSKQSDIDIAVWGLPSNNYFSAVAETIGFSREFKIDLVRFESCKSAFRKRVQSYKTLADFAMFLFIFTLMNWIMNKRWRRPNGLKQYFPGSPRN